MKAVDGLTCYQPHGTAPLGLGPVLGLPRIWLPNTGKATGAYSSGQTATERENKRLDHRAQEVINTNSVQK